MMNVVATALPGERVHRPMPLLVDTTLSRTVVRIVPVLDEPSILMPPLFCSTVTRLRVARTRPAPVGLIWMPMPLKALLLITVVSVTIRSDEPLGVKLMPTPPEPRTFLIRLFCTCSAAPLLNFMPLAALFRPSITRPRRITTSLAPAFTVIMSPEKLATPASPDPLSLTMLTALVMTTVPYPPGSMIEISPPGATWPCAYVSVWQGDWRGQVPESTPMPESQTRVG